ncbi:alanine/glycine:cation symporter family protein [Aureibacter tunicatorum]|uniref:AGCS family alanine or glycine:cation symporter n=1 Tax=Aureibacter tunicatorum TaxID=866807 RepID=A0AAE3XMB0_9BACT|nr:alanine/glycine:cation symporter family protein [Aureibacter tunicatorum]MDR6239062.1 AGCS family alanine or glycine:cation symporter [Aureibacter tunicatorum]BDD05012.1 sodium:alanine symporter [Aureibacter tunicatorum]
MLEVLEQFISQANTILWSYVLIILLIGAGLYFTFKNKFIQFKGFREMIRLLTESAGSTKDGVSSFQAFCMSTASRVGTGNLAGVAIAVVAGGPGAVFWMWVIALLGSASAFVESTLAQIYKERHIDSFRGGPAYYIEKALKNRSLGVVFSVFITVSFGFIFNSVQANTISMAFSRSFSIDPLYIGLALFVMAALVIFGGVRRIASVTEKIVPIMAILYILVVIYVMIANFSELPKVFALIIENAFGIKEVAGGAIGATLMNGIKRGLFSNEAGMGSAPNAAAAADVTHPVKQGLIQTLGVFTDTLLICSATAFLILSSGEYTNGELDGIQLTQKALESQVGDWGGIFVAVCIFLFAFSSIIGNYYYGESNIEFIKDDSKMVFFYRVFVLSMIVFGSVAKVSLVWDMADFFMGLMAIINLYAIIRLSPIAKRALLDYYKQKSAGKDPKFKASDIGLDEGVECWKD